MGKYKVIWRAKARRLYVQRLTYAYQEFGSKAFYHWAESVREMEDRLEEYPKAYTKVPELCDMFHEYRGHIIMRNFKVIYTINERRHVVKIITIWDMRMNPNNLKASIR